MIVTALQDFTHCGVAYKRGDTPNIVSTAARALRDRGLVSFNGLHEPHPTGAAGEDSALSALPPAQAVPQTTLSESDDGESETWPQKKRKRKNRDESEE